MGSILRAVGVAPPVTMLPIFLCCLCSTVFSVSVTKPEHSIQWDTYTHQADLETFLRNLEEEAPEISSVTSLGTSVKGRDILCIKLGSGVQERPLLRPMVKYVGNMHADETVGREILLMLAEYLVRNYGVLDRVTHLLDTTEVHLVPTMNPDGYENTNFLGHSPTRGNAEGVDLNRDFPTWEDLGKDRSSLLSGRQPETAALMSWILDNPFVLSANFHGGAVLANYPWDQDSTRPWTKSSLFREHTEGDRGQYTPDNGEFKALAETYSTAHKTMSKGAVSCVDNSKFKNGITNGVDWYVVAGGMQDFNYLYTNCMEITLELSCEKNPPSSTLQTEWENNKDSLLEFLESVYGAVRGVVTDQDGVPLSNAVVTVSDRAKDLVTSDRGEYWRLLLPGKYKLRALLGNRRSREVEVEIKEGEEGPRVDLQLEETFETTTTTTTTTEEPEKDTGLVLDIIPGICIRVSWSAGVQAC